MQSLPRKKIPAIASVLDEAAALDRCFDHKNQYIELSVSAARFFEDLTANFLSYIRGQQHLHLCAETVDSEGFFMCSIDYAHNGCGLTREVQDRALGILIKLGLVQKKVTGIPPIRWLKLNAPAYVMFTETINSLPMKWPVTYKKAAAFSDGNIVPMLTAYVGDLIKNSNFQNEENAQVYKGDLPATGCVDSTRREHRSNEQGDNEQGEKTQVNLRDEGQNPPSSGNESANAPLAVNTNPGAANQQAYTPANPRPNTAAYSKPKKPRAKPAPLPAHSAIPFMQELARTLAPILANQSHAAYPSEGDTAFKYHTDALANYDAIQTGAIMARTLDKPERYTDPAAWGNTYRMERAKLWAHDPATMEADLLTAARIYATTRAANTTVAKIPNVAAFLYGSTTSGGFLPWWNFIKPVEAMEAKEKAVLQKVEREEGSKPRYLEMEERGQIERDDFYHRKFVKLFGREPKQFKETTK